MCHSLRVAVNKCINCFPLKVGPLKIQLGGLGERCELPSGVKFGAF